MIITTPTCKRLESEIQALIEECKRRTDNPCKTDNLCGLCDDCRYLDFCKKYYVEDEDMYGWKIKIKEFD
jgi:hypothetical protein|nr:MAG TPA: putative exonuclease [Bacteriophage sp.]